MEQQSKPINGRPIVLTILCVIIAFQGTMATLALFLKDNSNNYLNTPFNLAKLAGIAGLISIGGAVGIWLMKKWGAYLIFLYALLTFVSFILVRGYNTTDIIPTSQTVTSFIFLAIYIIPLIIYWEKLK